MHYLFERTFNAIEKYHNDESYTSWCDEKRAKYKNGNLSDWLEFVVFQLDATNKSVVEEMLGLEPGALLEMQPTLLVILNA